MPYEAEVTSLNPLSPSLVDMSKKKKYPLKLLVGKMFPKLLKVVNFLQ
jgi:hypothetical protein